MMKCKSLRTTAVLLIVALSLTTLCSSFTTQPHGSVKRALVCRCHATNEQESSAHRRRLLLTAAPLFFVSSTPALAVADTTNLLPLIQQARRQLDSVPDLIEKEKWDSVRAILIQPPLSECWTKNTKMLRSYAENNVEDELAALEAREDVVSHLRFLDMAVYNNVFNPIATEGTSGATKELIRSYYEDPINEWKASVAALEELIRLGTEE